MLRESRLHADLASHLIERSDMLFGLGESELAMPLLEEGSCGARVEIQSRSCWV